MNTIPWEIIIPAVLAILLLLAGGYIRNLITQTKELIDAIHDALKDDKVDDAELAIIIKEAKDVGQSIKDIILAIGHLRDKP